jgi:hypothetical protein
MIAGSPRSFGLQLRAKTKQRPRQNREQSRQKRRNAGCCFPRLTGRGPKHPCAKGYFAWGIAAPSDASERCDGVTAGSSHKTEFRGSRSAWGCSDGGGCSGRSGRPAAAEIREASHSSCSSAQAVGGRVKVKACSRRRPCGGKGIAPES